MKNLWRSAAVAAGVLVMAGAAQAAPIQAGDSFTVSGGGSIRGGQFQITSTASPDAFDDFSTFCVEVLESISMGGPYTVQALATQTSTGTALSGGAAYLYTAFATNTLAGYSVTKQNALQAAIWTFQGYGGFVYGGGQSVASFVAGSPDAQAYLSLAGAQAWQSSGQIGDVRIMQNVNARGQGQQDFLMLQSVPEPATLLLLGAGLAGAITRRRRASTAAGQ